MDPFGIIYMMIAGMTLLIVTALPSIAAEALQSVRGVGAEADPLFFASLALAAAVVGLAYAWASRETRRLFTEFPG